MKRPNRTKRGAKSLILVALFLVLSAVGALELKSRPAPAVVPLSDASAVHFLDVGQGDSALLISGSDAVLIDAGTPQAAETVVDYLRAQGVTRLRAVIATHPHADHIGGMAEVITAFPIDSFYSPSRQATTQVYAEMIDALETQGVAITVPAPGDTLTLAGGASLQFLSPAKDADYGSDANDYSIVTMASFADRRILLMGDAETPVEEQLVKSNVDLSCDVLKAGHHGSRSSSSPAFLARTGAKTAIISCARDNDYGHPHPETIEDLQKAGFTSIRRTYEEGAIVLSFDTTATQQTVAKEEDAA